jgi:hypothetical protein
MRGPIFARALGAGALFAATFNFVARSAWMSVRFFEAGLGSLARLDTPGCAVFGLVLDASAGDARTLSLRRPTIGMF